jgi:uncharacterized repeat protein (TIGR01451 family)
MFNPTSITPTQGQTVNWGRSVKNNGSNTAVGVTMSLVISNGLSFNTYLVSKGSYDEVAKIWHIGDLAKDEVATISVMFSVVGIPTSNQSVSATAIGIGGDHDLGNNSKTDVLTLSSLPSAPCPTPQTHSPISGSLTDKKCVGCDTKYQITDIQNGTILSFDEDTSAYSVEYTDISQPIVIKYKVKCVDCNVGGNTDGCEVTYTISRLVASLNVTTNIFTDETLTGNGTQSNPLSVVDDKIIFLTPEIVNIRNTDKDYFGGNPYNGTEKIGIRHRELINPTYFDDKNIQVWVYHHVNNKTHRRLVLDNPTINGYKKKKREKNRFVHPQGIGLTSQNPTAWKNTNPVQFITQWDYSSAIPYVRGRYLEIEINPKNWFHTDIVGGVPPFPINVTDWIGGTDGGGAIRPRGHSKKRVDGIKSAVLKFAFVLMPKPTDVKPNPIILGMSEPVYIYPRKNKAGDQFMSFNIDISKRNL